MVGDFNDLITQLDRIQIEPGLAGEIKRNFTEFSTNFNQFIKTYQVGHQKLGGAVPERILQGSKEIPIPETPAEVVKKKRQRKERPPFGELTQNKDDDQYRASVYKRQNKVEWNKLKGKIDDIVLKAQKDLGYDKRSGQLKGDAYVDLRAYNHTLGKNKDVDKIHPNQEWNKTWSKIAAARDYLVTLGRHVTSTEMIKEGDPYSLYRITFR
jgi:hypothetical protein